MVGYNYTTDTDADSYNNSSDGRISPHMFINFIIIYNVTISAFIVIYVKLWKKRIDTVNRYAQTEDVCQLHHYYNIVIEPDNSINGFIEMDNVV